MSLRNARITCGLYINISIHDYLRVLMRKHAENTSWTLDPRLDMSWSGDKQGIERGIGNQVTIEFNVLYRFHSPISRRDAGWTKRFIQSKLREMGMYPGKKPNEHMTDEQFENGDVPLRCMRQVLTALNSESGSPGEKKGKPNFPDILWLEYFADGEWHWNKIKRGPTGHFSSADLVAEMVRTMEDPICKDFLLVSILPLTDTCQVNLARGTYRSFSALSRY